MKHQRLTCGLAACVLAASWAGSPWAGSSWAAAAMFSQAPTVERKVLLQQDAPTPGYQHLLVAVTIPPGGREGRHTHPGAAIVHVLEGALTLDHDGRPSATYKAGETLQIDAGRIHEGLNKGTVPVRAIASFVVEQGKPLAAQVP